MISRRRARSRAEKKCWLERQAQWNGEAVVFNPFERSYESADAYAANAAIGMAWFDRLPPGVRRQIANSADGQ